MKKKEIVIKVCNERIYFNPDLFIPIQQTSIPKKYLTFRRNEDIFWKVEILDYKNEEKCLKVSVIDYSTNDISNFDNQHPKNIVNNLIFEKFDWRKLEPLLSSYQESRINEYLFNTDTDSFPKDNTHIEKSNKFSSGVPLTSPTTSYFQPEEYEKGPISYTISEEFGVSFKDARFMLGYVSFKKFFPRLGKELEFKIENEHILAEFDNIKSWFAKKLKIKEFKATVTIKLRDNEVTEISASSIDISKITNELIDSVKYDRTKALRKKPRTGDPEKLLFTIEEIFTQIDTEDTEGNAFHQSEQDILDFFLKDNNIRNKKQLLYLSNKKQSENFRLHYTLNPNFGFLFLAEGTEHNHFVWELLNSHATYIWSIEKRKTEIGAQFKRIEGIINTIQRIGRMDYKREYNNNHRDNDLLFEVIPHSGITSNLELDFPKWKNKLNEQLYK